MAKFKPEAFYAQFEKDNPEAAAKLKTKGRPKEKRTGKRRIDAIPDLDPWTDNVVYENGKPTPMTIPVRKVSLLQRDHDRGMMPVDGKNDPVYAKFLDRIGMDELREALALDNSPKALNFLSRLVNPLYASVDICTLAKQCAIGYTDMMQIWRSHKLSSAMGTYIESSPVLAEHLIEDAKSVFSCCPRCDGAGVIKVFREEGPVWIECVNCNGTARIRKPGDAKSRDNILRAIGLIHSDGGNTVNVSINNTSGHTVTSVLEELERLPTIIPAVVLPEDDEL